MANDNLRIWNAVAKTDPNHTKKVEFGRKFTSIDAHWQIMQATKQFGPVGEGWGYEVNHDTLTLTPEVILAVADVTIWWIGENAVPDEFGTTTMRRYGPVRATCEIYGPKTYKGKIIPGEFVWDEDAPKKAMTDALTKGLSHLGFSADVFLGLFDDNRYVQKVGREFAAEEAQANAQAMGMDEAQRNNEANGLAPKAPTRNTGPQSAFLWTNAAIEALKFATSPDELNEWWVANKKAVDKLEANHPNQYERLLAASETQREAVAAKVAA